ncbi:cohesin domain-containing protein [Cellulosimicrobium sp. CUA-896]|uniref:cohesin domain-containing protein n=1 Tax=Cellulosimicrobium sp. CUA-896 TaxID=1517881 RepID=UPI0009FA694C|nr:cohesin domain-containing protein [Cellulosimicrobium sp. CUA-896]
MTAPASVEAGASIEVTVAVTGAADLYAYDLAVAYDPDLVTYAADSAVTPDGGFSDVADDGAGTVAVAHTRLGSSPGLAGDQTLATLTFTAVAAGDAAFAVPAVTLVGADSATVDLTDAGSATTTIAAAPVPTDDPTDDPSGTPTDPGTSDPDDDGSPDPTSTSGTGSGAGSGGSGGSGGPLASTGASVAAIVAAALLAVAAGVGVLVARRRAVADR